MKFKIEVAVDMSGHGGLKTRVFKITEEDLLQMAESKAQEEYAYIGYVARDIKITLE